MPNDMEQIKRKERKKGLNQRGEREKPQMCVWKPKNNSSMPHSIRAIKTIIIFSDYLHSEMERFDPLPSHWRFSPISEGTRRWWTRHGWGNPKCVMALNLNYNRHTHNASEGGNSHYDRWLRKPSKLSLVTTDNKLLQQRNAIFCHLFISRSCKHTHAAKSGKTSAYTSTKVPFFGADILESVMVWSNSARKAPTAYLSLCYPPKRNEWKVYRIANTI